LFPAGVFETAVFPGIRGKKEVMANRPFVLN